MQKRQGLILTLTALLTGLTLVGGVVVYFVLRITEVPPITSVETQPRRDSQDTSLANSDIAEPPVDTSVPVETASSPLQPLEGNLDSPQNSDEKNQNINQGTNRNKISNISNINNKNFGGVNWQKRDLRGKNLREAQLGGANLANANLNGVDLSRANLGGANLRGANLRGANLEGTDLRGANLDGADLRGTNLDAAFVDGANLQNAKLP